jgi:hypothetical protein
MSIKTSGGTSLMEVGDGVLFETERLCLTDVEGAFSRAFFGDIRVVRSRFHMLVSIRTTHMIAECIAFKNVNILNREWSLIAKKSTSDFAAVFELSNQQTSSISKSVRGYSNYG